MYTDTSKKQIILVRHAKAVEPSEWIGDDFDRPLTQSGNEGILRIANYLRLIGISPDIIISSPATRASQTALGLATKFGNQKIMYSDNLYTHKNNPSLEEAMHLHMDIVRDLDNTLQTIVLVGHNNDLTNFAGYLCGEGVPSMKKGSLIVLSLDSTKKWSDISEKQCKFIYYLTPHFLRLESLE